MMKKLLLFAAIIGFSLNLFGQELIGTPTSLIIVYNFPDNHFYLEIKGNEKKTTGQTSVYVIDNRLVQVLAINTNKFLSIDTSHLSKIDILKNYVKWESDYLKSTFNFDINNKIEHLKTKAGNDVLFWTYNMPTGAPSTKTDSSSTTSTQKQMFILRAVKNYVIGINTPLFENNQFESNKLFLYYNIDGIVESNENIDLNVLNNKVNKK